MVVNHLLSGMILQVIPLSRLSHLVLISLVSWSCRLSGRICSNSHTNDSKLVTLNGETQFEASCFIWLVVDLPL